MKTMIMEDGRGMATLEKSMSDVGLGSLVGLTFILNVGDFDQSISINDKPT